MTGIDPTYQPRPWRCEECGAILGYVLRDTDRVRRLWVLRAQHLLPLGDQLVFNAANWLRHGQDGLLSLWRVRGIDSGIIGCDFCGSLQEWHPSLEIARDLIRHVRGDIGVREFDRLMKSAKA